MSAPCSNSTFTCHDCGRVFSEIAAYCKHASQCYSSHHFASRDADDPDASDSSEDDDLMLVDHSQDTSFEAPDHDDTTQDDHPNPARDSNTSQMDISTEHHQSNHSQDDHRDDYSEDKSTSSHESNSSSSDPTPPPRRSLRLRSLMQEKVNNHQNFVPDPLVRTLHSDSSDDDDDMSSLCNVSNFGDDQSLHGYFPTLPDDEDDDEDDDVHPNLRQRRIFSFENVSEELLRKNGEITTETDESTANRTCIGKPNTVPLSEIDLQNIREKKACPGGPETTIMYSAVDEDPMYSAFNDRESSCMLEIHELLDNADVPRGLYDDLLGILQKYSLPDKKRFSC